MIVQENFAKRLNKILTMKNWKPVDLQNATGFGKSSISQYLSGINAPRQDRLYILSKVLNVSEAWLMGYDVPMQRIPDAERRNSNYENLLSEERFLLINFNKLNSDGKKKVNDYVCDLLENDKYRSDSVAKNDERIS